MGIFSILFKSRDKPTDYYSGSNYSFLFGSTTSGKTVNEFTAMQTTAVYSCVRILSEALASLPLHVYRYTSTGKERVYDHPLYHILHDEPNSEMTSFVFRETLMSHLLIWGNAYAQIIRDGAGRVVALYPLLPNKMEVWQDKNGEIFYTYSRTSDENYRDGPAVLRRQDVLHIPRDKVRDNDTGKFRLVSEEMLKGDLSMHDISGSAT